MFCFLDEKACERGEKAKQMGCEKRRRREWWRVHHHHQAYTKTSWWRFVQNLSWASLCQIQEGTFMYTYSIFICICLWWVDGPHLLSCFFFWLIWFCCRKEEGLVSFQAVWCQTVFCEETDIVAVHTGKKKKSYIILNGLLNMIIREAWFNVTIGLLLCSVLTYIMVLGYGLWLFWWMCIWFSENMHSYKKEKKVSWRLVFVGIILYLEKRVINVSWMLILESSGIRWIMHVIPLMLYQTFDTINQKQIHLLNFEFWPI